MDKPIVVKDDDDILIVDENAAMIALESRLRHGLVVDAVRIELREAQDVGLDEHPNEARIGAP